MDDVIIVAANTTKGNMGIEASSLEYKNVKIKIQPACLGDEIERAGGVTGGVAEQHAGHADRQAVLMGRVRVTGAVCVEAVRDEENYLGKHMGI